MNAPFSVAQAVTSSNTPAAPRIVKVTKPADGQAITVQMDGSVKLDLTAISNEKITLVRVGERLTILFENKSTVTIDPFFDASGRPLQMSGIELETNRIVTGEELATLFPITDDQSVLPAAGDQAPSAQNTGSEFGDPSVDTLASLSPLDLLGQEELGNWDSAVESNTLFDQDLVPELTGGRLRFTVEEENALPRPSGGDNMPARLALVSGGGNEDPNDASEPGSNGVNQDGADRDTNGADDGTTREFHGTGSNGLTALISGGTPPLSFFVVDRTGEAVVTENGVTITSGGSPVVYSHFDNSVSGQTSIEGWTGGESEGEHVFTLTIDSNGDWTFTLYGKLDHPLATNDDGTIPQGALEELLGIDLSSLVGAVDGNGSTLQISGAGYFVIDVIDDTPIMDVVNPQVANGFDFGDFVLNGNQWGQGSGVDSTSPSGAWQFGSTDGGPGSVQLERVGDGYLGMHSSTGGNMVDMDATANSLTLSQTLNLAPGETYQLSFEAGAPMANTAHLEVWFGGVKVADINPTVGSMQTYLVTLTGGATPASNLLEFRETGPDDNHGTYLANVHLVDVILDETAGDNTQSNDDAALASLFAAVTGKGVENDRAAPEYAQGTKSVVDVYASFGADGANATNPIEFSLMLVSEGIASGLSTTEGKPIALFTETYNGVDYVVGRYDTNGDKIVDATDSAAFALHVDGDGVLSVAEFVSLQHPNVNHHDEGIYLNDDILSVTVTVRDGDNDAITKSVDISQSIRFEDDGPSLVGEGSVSGEVDEDALFQANVIDGNQDAGRDGETAGAGSVIFTSTAASSLNSLVNFGADGQGEVPFKFVGVQAAEQYLISQNLTSAGSAINDVTINGSELTARSEDGRDVFKLTINDDGSWSFQLLDKIDHPLTSEPGEPGSTAFEDTISVSLGGLIDAYDGDGDHTNLGDADLSVIIRDDIPVAAGTAVNLITNGDFSGGDNWSPEQWWGSVAPQGQVPGWSITGDISFPPQNGIQFERQKDGFLDLHSSTHGGMIDMGGSPGNYVLSQSVGEGAAPDLVAGKQYVLQVEVGAPFPGTALMEVYWNGQLIGTIDTNVSSGQMEKFAFIVEGTGNPVTDVITFREVGQGDADLGNAPNGQDLQSEGYHGTYIANVQMYELSGVVDEDALNNANADGLGDSQEGDASPDETSVSGDLGVQWGADNADAADVGGVQDGANGAALTGRNITFADASVGVFGASELTSNGDTVSFALTNNDTRLVGFVDSNGVEGYQAGERLVFDVTLQDDGSGKFTFNLYDNLDHAPGASENDIALKFNFTATDSDGDQANGSFFVGVDDDLPAVKAEGITLTVDEDDIRTPWSEGTSPNGSSEFPGDQSTTENRPGNVDPAKVSGSVAGLLVGGGADNHITYGFTSQAVSYFESLNLFSKQTANPENGVALAYEKTIDGDYVVLSAYEPNVIGDGIDGSNPVFEFRLNTKTGAFEFRLFDELIHVAGNGENTDLRSGGPGFYDLDGDGVYEANEYVESGATIPLSALDFGNIITATDDDGDTVTFDGKLLIQVKDDIPEANIDTTSRTVQIDESGSNDSSGDDNTGSNSVKALFAGLEGTGQTGNDLDDSGDNNGNTPGVGAIAYAHSGGAVVTSSSDVGADAPALARSFALQVTDGTYSGLKTTDGQNIYLYMGTGDAAGLVLGRIGNDSDNNPNSPNASGTVAFAIAIEQDGDIAVAQYLSIHHNDTSEDDESASLVDGAVKAVVTVTDSDGDTDSESVNIGAHIVFEDDGPSITQFKVEHYVTVSHDETPGAQGDADDLNSALSIFNNVSQKGNDPHVLSGDKIGGAIGFAKESGLIEYGVDFGADGPASQNSKVFSLQLKGGNGIDSGLETTEGNSIRLYLENGIIVGRVQGGDNSGKAAFAIAIDSDGAVSLVQYLSIEHNNTGSHDESAGFDLDYNKAIEVKLVVKDGDGDTDTKTIDITDAVKFQDDGPSIEGLSIQNFVTVSHDETPGEQGDADDLNSALSVFNNVSQKGSDPHVATGDKVSGAIGFAKESGLINYSVDFGSDGPASQNSKVFTLQLKGGNGIDSGLETTEGNAIRLYVENGIIVGRVQGGDNNGKAAFAIAIDASTGAVSLVQYLSIEHDNTGSHDESVGLDLDYNKAIEVKLTVKDGDGDTDSATIDITGAIQFQDDGPSIDKFKVVSNVTVSHDETPGLQSDADDIGSALSVFNGITSVKGSDPHVASGNKIAGAIGFAKESGLIEYGVDFGSDGAASQNSKAFSLQLKGGEGIDSGLDTTEGDSIKLYVENGIVVGKVDGGPNNGKVAFAIAIDADDGDISLVQYLSIKHDDTNSTDESAGLNLGSNKSIEVKLTVKDGDGDTDSKTVDITNYIKFQDDGPKVFSNDKVVLEDDDLQYGNPGGVGDDDAPQNATGVLGHDFGSDGGSIKLLGADLPSGFTSSPNADGSVLTIKQGNTVVLTVTIDKNTGAYEVEQHAAIDHPNGNNENNVEFTIKYRVTDGDNDKVDGEIKINVDDDSPVVSTTATIVADEDNIAGGNNNSSTGDDNQQNLTGYLNVSYGADRPGNISFADMHKDKVQQTNGQDVHAHDGKDIYYFWDAATSTLYGSTNVTNLASAISSAVFTFVITDQATGAYDFDLLKPIDHADGSDENNVEFKLEFKATDHDGDSATGTVTIKIDDDMPAPTFTFGTGTLVVHDETPGLQNDGTGHPGNHDTWASFPVTVSNPGDDLHVAGPGAIGVAQSIGAIVSVTPNYGADGAGKVTYAIDVPGIGGQNQGNGVASGLSTTEGREIRLFEHTAPDGKIYIVGRYDENGGSISSGDKAAFAIHINADTGVVSVVQYMSIRHDDASDSDESNDLTDGNALTNLQSIINDAIRLTVTVTDRDNDAVVKEFSIGDRIAFDDDGPTASNIAAAVGANLIVNGSFEDLTNASGSIGGEGWGVFTQIPGWTRGNDGVPFEIQRNIPFAAQDGSNKVELDSDHDNNPTDSTNATIQQNVAGTVAGATYELSFWYAPRPDDQGGSDSSFKVLWNGQVVHSVDSATAGEGWRLITINVVATGPNSVLAFEADGAETEYGAFIDNVSLRAAVLDDDNQANGIAGGPGDDGDGISTTLNGALQFNAGADGLKSIAVDSVTANGGELKAIYVDPATKVATQYEVDTAWQQNGVGGTLTGTMNVAGVGIVTVFIMTVNADGTYSLNLQRPLAHPLSHDGNAGNGVEAEWEDNLALDFGYQVTDGDNDVASATLTVTVDDDTADANDDNGYPTVTAPYTFNVLGNDALGADGLKSIVVVGAPPTGLVNHGDGTFTYTPVDGQQGTVTFTYAVTDGDGDVDTATVTLNVDTNDIPELTVPEIGADGTVVSETGLPDRGVNGPIGTGENASAAPNSDNSEITSGKFTITSSDGITSITVGGEVIAFAELANAASAHIDVTTPKGTLTITNYDSATGEVSYTYTLGDNQDHTGVGNVTDAISITVTDPQGDSDDATLTITINDDAPTIDAAATMPDAVVDETDLGASDSADFSGAFVSQYGADGAGGIGYALDIKSSGADTGLIDTLTGQKVVLVMDGTTVVGWTETGHDVVFTVTVDATGKVTLDHDRAIKHADDTLPNETRTLSAADLVTLTATITDSDTDTDAATIDIGQQLVFHDDAPDATNDTDAVPAGSYLAVSGNVISGAGADGNAAGADSKGNDGATVTKVAFGAATDATFDGNGNLEISGDYGVLKIKADGSYTYTRNPGTDGGVSDTFTYTLTDCDGDTDTATLTINIGDSGVTLTLPEVGAAGTVVSEAGLPAHGAGASEPAGTQQATDNETVTGVITYALADVPATVTVNDVAVTVGNPIVGEYGTLTITAITSGTISYTYTLTDNVDHDSDLTPTDTFSIKVADTDDESATGILVITINDDGPIANNDTDLLNDVSNTATGNVITGFNTTNDGNADDIVGADDAAVSKVEGFAGAESGSANIDGNFAVAGQHGSLLINKDGTYTYTRSGNAPLTATDTFTYTLTDNDGTSSTATLTISIDDKGVTVGGLDVAGGEVTVYENDLANGSSPGGALTKTGTFSFAAADGVDDITIGGTAVVTNGAAAGTLPITVDSTAYGVLTVTGIDLVNKTISYSYTLNDNAQHAAVAGENTLVHDFQVVVTDTDGDSADGTLTVNVVDDVPLAKADTDDVGSQDVGTIIGGNVITGTSENGTGAADTQGADGPVSVVGVQAGTTTGIDSAGTVGSAISGAFGKLTIAADGTYSYERTSAGEGTDTFTYTIKDADGDLSHTTIKIELDSASELIIGSSKDDTGNPTDNDPSNNHQVPKTVGDDGEIVGTGGNDVVAGDPGAVTLTPGTKANIVLVLDTSYSMVDSTIQVGNQTKTRLEALKDSVELLLNQLGGSQAAEVRVHIVKFSENGSNVGTFNLKTGDGLDDAIAAINNLSSNSNNDSGTNYEAGLYRAYQWINGTAGGSFGSPISVADGATVNKVLFISDGEPNAWLTGAQNNTVGGATSATYNPTALAQVVGSTTGVPGATGSTQADGTDDRQQIEGHASFTSNPFVIEAVGIGLGTDALNRLSIVEQGPANLGDTTAISTTTGAELTQGLIGALTGSTQVLSPAGNDVIKTGGGNDLVYGDVLFTDNVPTAAAPDGTGYQVFQNLGWTELQISTYIREHAFALAQESMSGGKGRGNGNDEIHGGAGSDLIFAQEGNDNIFQTWGEGRDFVHGGVTAYDANGVALPGGDLDTYHLDITNPPAGGVFIETVAEYNARLPGGGNDYVFGSNPILTGTDYATSNVDPSKIILISDADGNITAELYEIEKIEVTGTAAPETIVIGGDFSQTHLLPSTIEVKMAGGADTLDLSDRVPNSRVVADGGADTDTAKLDFNVGNITALQFNGTTVSIQHHGITDQFSNFENFEFANGTDLTFAGLLDLVSPPDAPSIVSVTDDVGTIAGPVSSGGVSNDTALVVRVDLAADAKAGDTVTLYNNTTLLVAVVLTQAVIDAGHLDITTPTLSHGSTYAFNVTSASVLGGESGHSGNHSVTIDTTALAPALPALDGTSDTGTSGDNKTNDTTPTLKGTGAEANAAITIYDGANPIGNTTADADGKWSFTPSSALTPGEHNITVTQTDAAGNTSNASSPLALTIDTTVPTVTITDDASGTATGAVVYTFKFSEAVTGFTVDDIAVTNGTKGTLSGSGDTYTLTVTPTANASGNMTVSVAADKAQDAAGNGNAENAGYAQAFNTINSVPTDIVFTGNAALAATTTGAGGGSPDTEIGAAAIFTLSTIDPNHTSGFTYTFNGSGSQNVTIDGSETFTMSATTGAVTMNGLDYDNGVQNIEFTTPRTVDPLGAARTETVMLRLGTNHLDDTLGDANYAHDQVIYGFGGNDNLSGGGGNDWISGGDGNDTLIGGNGKDTLLGGANDDTIRGGAGDDILDGGLGIDLIDFSDATGAINFTLVQSANDTALSAAGLGTDTYRNMEGIIGSAFGDTLTGSGGADVINGGGGVDTINGGAGGDTLIGGAGADSINTGAANDDVRDTIVFSATTDYGDTILNFDALGSSGSQDRISLRGDLSTLFDDGNNDGSLSWDSNGGNVDLGDDNDDVEALLMTAAAGVNISNANDVANAFEAYYNVNSTDGSDTDTSQALLVINNSAGTQATVWQYSDTGSNNTISGSELTLIATINTNAAISTGNFDLANN